MKKSYITNGFASLTGPNLITKSQKIKTGMVENFATAPDLPALITKIDTYGINYTAALSGSATDRALRDQAKEDLVNELHRIAYWVMYTCNGDRAQLISSGFQVNREENIPTPPPTAAKGQKLTDGIGPGMLEYSFERVLGATSYIYQITADPTITAETVWTEVMGSKAKYTFTGLESGKRYWVRVLAIGKDGQCVCSEPISRISQ